MPEETKKQAPRFGDKVSVKTDGTPRTGRVLDVQDDHTVIVQMLELGLARNHAVAADLVTVIDE